MKIRIFFLALTLILLALTEVAVGQPPLPPGNGHGSENNLPAGAGAPIGNGVMILIALSTVYGIRKAYSVRREKSQVD